MKWLDAGSWLCLGVAVVVAIVAVAGHWAINAEAFGAHDMGLALSLAFASSVAADRRHVGGAGALHRRRGGAGCPSAGGVAFAACGGGAGGAGSYVNVVVSGTT